MRFKIINLLWLFVINIFVVNDVSAAALQAVAVKNALYDVPGLGNRPLKIKAYPAIANFQSDLYEVYAEPYTYDLHAQSAVAILEGESEVKGEIVFLQRHPPGGPIFIRGNITGLTAGKHGLHIHQAGDLRAGCEKLGGHFNPYLSQHGGPKHPIRHVGDLGNVEASESGTAEIVLIDPLMSLSGGPRGIVGRAVVVTSDPDDLGLGGNANSLTDGNAGKPLACGVVAYIR